MPEIRIAIAGVGNCASSLMQGLAFYAQRDEGAGLKHAELGGYRLSDIVPVAAFDIDVRKVGRPLEEAILAPPNNARQLVERVPKTGITVEMGPIMDGVAAHMREYPEHQRFEPSDAEPVDVVQSLRRSGAEILLNYLPVGSQRASEFYAEACLSAGVSLINCIPVFIVSDARWAKRFADRGLPCIGDDVKAQLGATITHRALVRLFEQRGVRLDRTYQLNAGGNSDFLNMLGRDRLASKKTSKTEAVQSELQEPLDADQIHIGPSDFIPFLKDNKICFLRMEGSGFGGAPVQIELRLSVEDSPNSAGVVVDAIRCCKLARDAGIGGPIAEACAWTMKHPPVQMADDEALTSFQKFVAKVGKNSHG
jgi:myo-inositol-1-phosphate synthase